MANGLSNAAKTSTMRRATRERRSGGAVQTATMPKPIKERTSTAAIKSIMSYLTFKKQPSRTLAAELCYANYYTGTLGLVLKLFRFIMVHGAWLVCECVAC